MPMIRCPYGYRIDVLAIEKRSIVVVAFLFIGITPEALFVDITARHHVTKTTGLP